MDYLHETRGNPSNVPDLHYLFLRWILDTYGEDWFHRSADLSMNWMVVGYKPEKMILIEFDDKHNYSRIVRQFGVFDISLIKSAPDLLAYQLMPLNLADPEFFPQLKKLIDEFTPSATLDELKSNGSSAKAILRSSLADSNRDFS